MRRDFFCDFFGLKTKGNVVDENGAKMEGSGTCRVSTLMPRWHVHGCKHPHLHTKDFETLYSRDPKKRDEKQIIKHLKHNECKYKKEV